MHNQYVRMTILPGWTVDTSKPPLVRVIRGKYVLTIDPIYTHASGIVGGRFGEATQGMRSVEAVRAGVEGPWGTDCAQPNNALVVTKYLSLANLYTEATKANAEEGCKFPADGKSAWFGALFVGEGSESEYTITLAYNTTDVNALPKKGNPELKRVFSDVATMLKTMELKPPLVVSSVEPNSAQPGATIKVLGSGFSLPGNDVRPRFVKVPNLEIPKPTIAPDGKSLTFVLPTSVSVSTCPPGYIMQDGKCVVVPAGYDETNDCPRRNDDSANFCGMPFPPGTYELEIVGSMVQSNKVILSVMPPKPTPVSISMLYPNYMVDPGESITVRGKGFTASGNTVKIGSAIVSNVPSSGGRTLTFPAPMPAGSSFMPGLAYYLASVANSNGESNSITVVYRYADPNNPNRLRWQKMPKPH